MAQKRINDLQLRTDFDATCNMPSDDLVQTWRVTGQQIKDFILANGNITSIMANFTKPTIQKLTSGSGTYTTPAGVKLLRIRMSGGGGGGQGSSTAGWSAAAGNGGSTSFGTSLLVSPGGLGGYITGGSYVATPTINSPAIEILKSFFYGGSGAVKVASAEIASGFGGQSIFGGGAQGLISPTVGKSGAANTGSGGSGASLSAGAIGTQGAGGGSGYFLEAFIPNPGASYSYSIGAGGTAGVAGTSGLTGGVGGSGVIIIEEYYQ